MQHYLSPTKSVILGLLTWLLAACSSVTPTASIAPRLAHLAVRVVVTCPGQQGHAGSGVIVTPEGHVITAYHVVQEAFTMETCTVEVGKGRRINEPVSLSYVARPIAHDPAMDVALLLIVADRLGRSPREAFPAAALAPEPPAVGETIHVVGFPTLSEGVLAYDRDTVISVGDCDSAGTCWLLTEAFASWGSSGGPVFDDQGRLVGITIGQREMVMGTEEHRITTVRPVSVIRDLMTRATNTPAPLDSTLAATLPANVQMDEWQVEVIGPLGANWRSEPSTERGMETVIGVLERGTILHVIPPGEWEGWWAVADNQGRIGWIKERGTNTPLVRAFLSTVTPRLSAGMSAVVTCLTQAPCAHLRYSPGYAAPNDEAVVGSLAGGARVDVLEGPYYVNRLVWWRVRSDTLDGWLPEVTEEGYRLLAPLPAWK